MLGTLKSLIQDEEGQGMVEYGLVLGVLAVGSILFILSLRHNVGNLVYKVTSKIGEEINNISSI